MRGFELLTGGGGELVGNVDVTGEAVKSNKSAGRRYGLDTVSNVSSAPRGVEVANKASNALS